MSKIIDSETTDTSTGGTSSILQIFINCYAFLLTLVLALVFFGLEIKTEPSPVDSSDVLEIQSSYSMLAGICINVGDCGGNQVVLGLEKNSISEQLYHFLLWKKNSANPPE